MTGVENDEHAAGRKRRDKVTELGARDRGPIEIVWIRVPSAEVALPGLRIKRLGF
jgi:hypothetical protein